MASEITAILFLVLSPTVFAVTETYKMIEGVVPHQEMSIDLSNSGKTLILCADLCLNKKDPECFAFTFDKSGTSCDLYSERAITITESLHSSKTLYISHDVTLVPYGYMFNPHSESCIQLITTGLIHADAQAHCEAIGEKLATFRTAESMQWLRDQHSDTGDLGGKWIGLEWTGEDWAWNGNISDPLDDEQGVWCSGEPSSEGSCVDTLGCAGSISLNDVDCGGHQLGFLCEKRPCLP